MTELQHAPDGYPIKLVRDRTASIINSTGEPGDLFYRPIVPGSQEHKEALWKKLVEEVGEYLVDPGMDELIDILAVLDGIARNVHGTGLLILHDKMQRDHRGLFRDAIMMYGRHEEFDSGPMPAAPICICGHRYDHHDHAMQGCHHDSCPCKGYQAER